MASDDFNRTEDPLSTGWATGMGGLSNIKANGTDAQGTSAAADHVAVRTGTYPDDQFSEVVIGTQGDDGGPLVRGSTTAAQGYFVDTSGNLTVLIIRLDAGPSFTVIATVSFGAANTAGAVYRLTIAGSVLTPTRNGATGTLVSGSLTDATYASGSPGIHLFDTALTYDSWNGTDPAGGATTILPQMMAHHGG